MYTLKAIQEFSFCQMESNHASNNLKKYHAPNLNNPFQRTILNNFEALFLFEVSIKLVFGKLEKKD